MRKVLLGSMVMLLAVGCIPEKPELDDETTDSGSVRVEKVPLTEEEKLVEEWLAMASDPGSYQGEMRPYQICDELAQMSPTALSPFIALLEEPDSSGETKMFVLQSININMTPSYIPQLFGLLESEESTTRSCAVTLLGGIRDDAVVERLKLLQDDDDDRVAFSALSGLAQQLDDPYRASLVDYYFTDEATRARKTEIFRIILLSPRESDCPILESEVVDAETDVGVRHVAAMLLGNLGNLDSIPSLEKSLEIEPSEQFQQLVLSTIATLQERYKA
jgi:HEAT repeat protein